MNTPPASDLDSLIAELEHAAAELRAGKTGTEEAAALVERCAELAARIGGELDRQARATASDPEAAGQEKLL